MDPSAASAWRSTIEPCETARVLLDLYAPLCAAPALVLGHLGQSLDGYVADTHGRSQNLSSPENIVHLHRLRALFDAVVVGRNTAQADNPRLTTRLVEGAHPVRVVVDPALRCSPDLGLFSDGVAPTLIVCGQHAPARSYPAATQVVRLQHGDTFRMLDVVQVLRAEGLTHVFIEGGGVTVSRALAEGALDRLHLAVAPILLGGGASGLSLREPREMSQVVRPACRQFAMGADVLFDFALR